MFLSRKLTTQKGSVYIISIFIIVVMGMLALNMFRIAWSNQDVLAREVLGNQASLLAKSANEWGLTHLFPLNGSEDFSAVSARCISLAASVGAAATALVENSGVPCNAPTIECEAKTSNRPQELRYVKLTSIAICNEGNIYEVERKQTAWVKGVKDD